MVDCHPLKDKTKRNGHPLLETSVFLFDVVVLATEVAVDYVLAKDDVVIFAHGISNGAAFRQYERAAVDVEYTWIGSYTTTDKCAAVDCD